MNEIENINLIVASLKKVPGKRLMIIELANSVPRQHGDFNVDALRALQPEINLAIAEAKVYGAHTMMAVSSLAGLKPRRET
ncbi:MAG: hypothetical protein KAV87_05200 [Desulfobacteraceae bacterium]|nr:hypothetical protein [Desulfobacteraceae bacterium]